MQFLCQDALRLSMFKGQDYGKMYLHLVHHERRPLISKENIPSHFFNVTLVDNHILCVNCDYPLKIKTLKYASSN